MSILTLPYVILLYELMRKNLDTSAKDTGSDPLVRNVAGLEKLMGYYTEVKASRYVLITTGGYSLTLLALYCCRIQRICAVRANKAYHEGNSGACGIGQQVGLPERSLRNLWCCE